MSSNVFVSLRMSSNVYMGGNGECNFAYVTMKNEE